MSRRRLMFINAVLLLLLGVHLYENVVDSEHWPFCSYRMYSWLETERSVTTYRVVGVRDDGTETLIHKNEFIHPFDQIRLNEGLQNAHHGRGLGVHALNDVLRRYEHRRQGREHSGPPIVRVRLYRMKHALEPWASNLHSPTERELLAESDPLE
jgi:hypothetical protein